MRIRNITAAVLLGLGTISAPVIIPQAYAADMETQAIADQVKARIANLDKAAEQAYQRLLNHYPTIKSIKVETGDYQDTDSGATAVTKVTITRNPAYLDENEQEDIVFSIKDNISYSNELMEQDILARINGEVELTDSLKNLLEIDKEDADELNKALEYLVITTELRPDGEVGQLVQIKPFTHEEDGEKTQFEGLTVDSRFNESKLADGVGEINLEFGKLTIQNGPDDVMTITPFNVDYKLEDDGDMAIKSSPFKIEHSEDNMLITSEGLEGKGSDLKFDDQIGAFTGDQEFVINEIKISDDTMPAPIIIDSIRFTSEAEKDDELYDFGSDVKIDLNGKSISEVSGLPNLEIEDIEFKVNFEDISSLTFQTINYQLPAIAELEDDGKIQQSLQTLITDMANHESALKLDTAFNTDQGNATFVANIKAKKDAVNDPAQWEAAFNSPEPTAAINLMQKSFDFDLKVTVPESLVKAVGMEAMMGMTAGYVIKTGSDYSIHIENTDDGIELNGNLMPLPQ